MARSIRHIFQKIIARPADSEECWQPNGPGDGPVHRLVKSRTQPHRLLISHAYR